MKFQELLLALVKFAEDPESVWGAPRVQQYIQGRISDQQDKNEARLRSGTYTQAQFDNYTRMNEAAQRFGNGYSIILGTPYSLPDNIPERSCTCGRIFRSVYSAPEVDCYDCALDKIRPSSGINLDGRVYNHDNWWLYQVLGDECHYWWNPPGYAANFGYQGLRVRFNDDGSMSELRFATVARIARKTFDVTFSPDLSRLSYGIIGNCTVINWDNQYTQFLPVYNIREHDPFRDLMVQCVPRWMYLDDDRLLGSEPTFSNPRYRPVR